MPAICACLQLQVELLNPSGGAEVGVASTIEILIQHSDQAFGVFQFDVMSLDVTVSESSDSGYDVVELEVKQDPKFSFHTENSRLDFSSV